MISSVVHLSTVTDPTTWQLGRSHSSTLKHFRTSNGPCHAILYRWGLGHIIDQQQTINHVINTYCRLH